MKHLTRSIATASALAVVLSLAAAQDEKAARPAAPPKAQAEKPSAEYKDPKVVSYLLGGDIGANIKRNGLALDLDEFVEGLRLAIDGRDLKYSDEMRRRILSAYGNDRALPKPLVEKVVSYLMGGNIGANIKRSGLRLELDEFVEGLKLAAGGKALRYPEEERRRILTAFSQDREFNDRRRRLMAAFGVKTVEEWEALAARNKEAGEAFLAANARKEGVKTAASGLQYQVITQGKGATPKPTDRVKAVYKGTLIDDGRVFIDSTVLEPAERRVCDEPPGLAEALQMMPPGSKWKLFLPPALAYQESGRPPLVGPNAALILEVELKEIVEPTPHSGPQAADSTEPIAITFPVEKGGEVETTTIDPKTGKPAGKARAVGPRPREN